MAEPQKLKIETGTNSFTMKGRPCELSAFSFIPTERDDPPERTVFNTPKQVFVVQEIYLNYHVYMHVQLSKDYSLLVYYTYALHKMIYIIIVKCYILAYFKIKRNKDFSFKTTKIQ